MQKGGSCIICTIRPPTHSFASLTRAPSLRSVAVLRCAQPSLRSAGGSASSSRIIPVGVPWAHPVRGASQVDLGFAYFMTPGGVPVRFTFGIGGLRVPPLTNTLPW